VVGGELCGRWQAGSLVFKRCLGARRVLARVSECAAVIAALTQALVGLGTGGSPSSSGCSPSAQTLLSRAQSRSSTLSSAPIMHFLTLPSCRGLLVKFRRRFSGCPVPGT
jgi:hypothetical protein